MVSYVTVLKCLTVSEGINLEHTLYDDSCKMVFNHFSNNEDCQNVKYSIYFSFLILMPFDRWKVLKCTDRFCVR